MKQILTALTVAATMFASSASAFDPDDLQELLDTNGCSPCELSGANLSKVSLREAFLGTGVNLSNANLKNSDLTYAYFGTANLRNANFTGANLVEALMRNADFTDANLTGADLTGANLKGAILCNTTMPDGSVIYSGC